MSNLNRLLDWATGKEIRNTPEEAVRQEYERVLVDDYGYVKEQLNIEVPIQRGSNKREKADIVIYKTGTPNRRDQGRDILGIVETKRKDRKDGVEQLTSYMSATCCSWGVWTNGEEIEYLYKEPGTGEVKREAIYQIPKRGENIEDIGSFTKNALKPASNLKLIFKRLLNTLYTNTNISRREKLGNEMIRLLFCKMYDESYNSNDLPLFRIEANDKDDDFSGVKNRIDQLFNSVKKDLGAEGVFDDSEKITLENKSIAYVVGELQMYSLINTDADTVGDAFEVFAESKLVGEKGEFFTPRQIVKMAIDFTKPEPDETILDPACGSGGFLIFALEHIWDRMKQKSKWKGMSSDRFEKAKIKMAEKSIHGIDKEIDLVKITKAYMAFIGDGKSRIVQQNSLHEAQEFGKFAKEFFVESNGGFKEFDVILTNPPFGSKETKVLESESKHFDLGYKWKRGRSGLYEKTNSVRKTPAQELFIERCLNMLKTKGRMAIVLPETYFHAPTKKYIIQYIKSRASINAVIDLPHNTFRPHCNAKTLLLVLEKGGKQGNIIFGVAEEVGKDHLGKIKKRPTSDGHISDDVWDDSESIRSEIHSPSDTNNKYVFSLHPGEVKNDIYVPRYYWNRNPRELERQADNINCFLVSIQELLDQDIIEIFRGHGSPKNEFKGLGEVPYVRAGDIGDWAIYKNPVSCVPSHIYQEVKGQNGVDLKPHDIIFVKEGSYRIGDVALVLPTDTGILLNSHCFVIRVKNTQNDFSICPYYLMYLLSHPLTKNQLHNKVFIDTTLPNIGDRWRELQLPISRSDKKREAIKNDVSKIFTHRAKSAHLTASMNYGR